MAQQNFSDLTLYFKPSCPYCVKVIDFMERAGISIKMKDLSNSTALRDELIELGGKKQVPCLSVSGKAMYESDAIISYLASMI